MLFLIKAVVSLASPRRRHSGFGASATASLLKKKEGVVCIPEDHRLPRQEGQVEAVQQRPPRSAELHQRLELVHPAAGVGVGEAGQKQLGLQEVEDRFRQTYLAFQIIGFAAFTLFQVWMLSLLSGRHYVIPGEAFVAWKAPEQLVWVLIVSGFVFFIAEGLLRQVGLNLLIVLLLVYYVQGLAVITDLFERRQFPVFLRAMGYAMTIFLGPLPFAGIGVFDLWIDFRKKRIKGNKPF